MAFNALLELLQQLGFTINWDKVVTPYQSLTFLGIQINSVTPTLSLDQIKLNDLRNTLHFWRTKCRAPKRELQQLAGKLNWAARVIRGGRIIDFLRRIIDLSNKLSAKTHHVRLDSGAKADITWWSNLSDIFNGTAFFIEEQQLPQQVFIIDASSTGGAGLYASDWFYTRWSADHIDIEHMHINHKELFTVLMACRRWHTYWDKRHIVVYTDNKTTMYIINSGTSRNMQAMTWIRELFWLSATSNFYITARYVNTKENSADALSRMHA
ncbi:uncharacterized protein LOC144433135 [Glandiceps talaboti]